MVSTKGVILAVYILKAISDVQKTVTLHVTPPAQTAENEQCDWRKWKQGESAHIVFAFHDSPKREFR
jgi:hypothetical protein